MGGERRWYDAAEWSWPAGARRAAAKRGRTRPSHSPSWEMVPILPLSLSAWLQSEGGRHNGVIGTQPPKIAEVGLDTLSHHACRAPFFSSRRCSRDSVLLSARAAACHPADRPAIFLPVLILPRRQAVADCNSNSNLILRPALVTIHLFLASIWTRASAAAHDDFRLRSLLVQRTSTTWHLLKAAAMASLVCCATFRRRMLPPRHTMAPH